MNSKTLDIGYVLNWTKLIRSSIEDLSIIMFSLIELYDIIYVFAIIISVHIYVYINIIY